MNPFGFSFEAQEEVRYIIEVTQDLEVWNQIDTHSNSGGIIKYIDKRIPEVPYSENFYRVKVVR